MNEKTPKGLLDSPLLTFHDTEHLKEVVWKEDGDGEVRRGMY